MKNRFKDKNYGLLRFTKKMDVYCPDCGKHAIITDNGILKLHCEHCKLFLTKKLMMYSYRIRHRCPQCDKMIYKDACCLEEKETFVSIECKCGFSRMYKPTYKCEHGYYQKPNSEYTYFDTKLWYSKSFKNEVFWALNMEHLHYLKHYITAKLRERNNREYMTLVETLPDFIKSKKNRLELLKLIETLEKK